MLSPLRARSRAFRLGVAALLTVASGVTGVATTLATAPAASAATAFTATEDLNGRDGPSLDANTVVVNKYRKGATVSVVCQAKGEMAYGSTIWDKTTDNLWVPDYYIKTGYEGFVPGLARCNDTSGDAHNFPAKVALNGRNAPNLSATVVQVDMYAAGEQVPIVCQTTGGAAYGSTIWDKTDDGVWVPDAYVKTGSDGFAAGVPRCTSTSAPTSFRYLAKTDLNGRSTKSVSAAAVKVYPGGSTITITCQAIGGNAYGSNIWDKTSDGLWVADYYVKTGFDGFVPGAPRCADDTSGSGSGYVTKDELNGRSTKKVSAPAVKIYPNGSTIKITCQAYGEYAYGSNIWDKTSDNLFVPDYYVKTGTTGFISGMPRCDNDQPTGGPSTGGGGGGGGSPSTGGGTCDTAGHGRTSGSAGPTTGTSAQKVERVIAAAQAMTGQGLTYSWGAGGKAGPTCGIAALSPGGYNDYNRFGFDCSGYSLYAYWKGAGVNIGSGSSLQSKGGTQLSWSQRKRGDLIFWGTPGHTSHVAIYLGNDRMLEAAPPRNGSSVHEIGVYGSHSYVIRVV